MTTITQTYVQRWNKIDPAFRHLIIGVLAIAVLSLLGGLLFRGDAIESPQVGEQKRSVQLRTVGELANEQGILTITGTVVSRDEATLIPEAQGRYTRVYVQLGDSVRAGDVIAEIDNARERAVVQQATGAYRSALAQADKVSGGARSEQITILELSQESAKNSIATTQSAAVGTILSAYATIDDAVNKRTDSIFSQPSSDTPSFSVLTSNSKSAIEAQNLRRSLLAILAENAQSARSITADSRLLEIITKTENDLRTTRTYLDVLIEALAGGIESSSVSAATIAAAKAEAIGSRAAVSGAVAALAGAREQLTQREAAYRIAVKNLEIARAGGQIEDVQATRGGLEAAEGALAIARASLEKTIIRAPFSGTVNSLTAEVGAYATPQIPAATIANNQALEIVGAITEFDRGGWTVGSFVSVNGTFDGVVTRLAPALDPVTKKIEVRIGLTEPAPSITNGQVVRIEYLPKVVAANRDISLPIETLKITPDGTYVLSVSDEGLIVQNEVTLGGILGERIEITSPLDEALRVVVDARGLSEGMAVSIDN